MTDRAIGAMTDRDIGAVINVDHPPIRVSSSWAVLWRRRANPHS
jgi:hypothetical protein